jgi:NAD(P)-dependent dehydrogenase (short-subunit alcohol dehydrogenase family)
MLNGKKVIVVGGSSGIGRGVAEAALERGAEVVIVGRSRDKLDAATRELGETPRLSAVVSDMRDEADVARLFESVGAFDHLVITAGTAPAVAPIGSLDLGVARDFVGAKFLAAVGLVKHAQRTLRPGGSITFTSGINKDRPPVPGGGVVAAVAGAFGYLAHALALELAPTRVNVVSPGWVDTPMWDELVGDAKSAIWQDLAQRLPAGRVASPKDVALAYVFVMESAFTTGTTIHIDGGHSLI